MKFYKYHGAGNDFILIDNLKNEIPEKRKSKLAEKLCDRHFGIGSDGLMLAEKSESADIRMRFFNPDGSEPEMCGNGIRCFAKHVYERRIVRGGRILIETKAGLKEAELTVEKGKVVYVAVEMGAPVVNSISKKIDADGREFEISVVDTGVPHVVILVDDVDRVDVRAIGSSIRHNRAFKGGTNVNFLEKAGRNVFKIRTYERGVEGETLACGTGIAASGAVAVLRGIADADKPIEIRARGGTVFVDVRKKGDKIDKIYMRGPANFIFKGNINDCFDEASCGDAQKPCREGGTKGGMRNHRR